VESPQAEIIFAVEEAPEGGYTARALGHSIFTEADTVKELRLMLRDAVQRHFDEAERPALIRLHLVRDELIPA
jgi:hypothetical protein